MRSGESYYSRPSRLAHRETERVLYRWEVEAFAAMGEGVDRLRPTLRGFFFEAETADGALEEAERVLRGPSMHGYCFRVCGSTAVPDADPETP